LDNDATSASAFLVTDPATAAGGGNTVLSNLTCNGSNNHDSGCLGKRKSVWVTMDLQGERALLPPRPVPVPLAFWCRIYQWALGQQRHASVVGPPLAALS
jgi:E3 ubiquitin-protein ligase BOI-like protein